MLWQIQFLAWLWHTAVVLVVCEELQLLDGMDWQAPVSVALKNIKTRLRMVKAAGEHELEF